MFIIFIIVVLILEIVFVMVVVMLRDIDFWMVEFVCLFLFLFVIYLYGKILFFIKVGIRSSIISVFIIVLIRVEVKYFLWCLGGWLFGFWFLL